MKFEGKTALVTGAAAGIGKAVAIKLAKEGAKVAIIDVDAEKLEPVKKEILAFTKDVAALKCDISNETEVYETVKVIVSTSTDEWRKFIDINVLGTVYCTKAVLPKMLENKYGKIVNVSSVAGVYGNANMVHYSATKGAVIAMTKALAKEVIDKGVYVNCVSPGTVSPEMDTASPNELSYLGRQGTCNENANLICFLASDDATYIAGQNIQIDGCRKKQ